MLQDCELELNPNDKNCPHDAMHVYAQIVHCDEWNENRLKLLPGREFTNKATDSKKMTALNLQRHSDTLTLNMIDKSIDMFIAHFNCNNKGGGVAQIVNTNLNPKQIRINTILEIVVVEKSKPI